MLYHEAEQAQFRTLRVKLPDGSEGLITGTYPKVRQVKVQVIGPTGAPEHFGAMDQIVRPESLELACPEERRILNQHGAAIVSDEAEVAPTARLSDAPRILAGAKVLDNAVVAGSSVIRYGSVIRGHAAIQGDARVTRSEISDVVLIDGNAKVYGARVSGRAYIGQGVQISGDHHETGEPDARVYGNATLVGAMYIGSGADIFRASHVVTVTGISPQPMTVYRTATGHRVQAGCQNFELTEDLEALAQEHGWLSALLPGWKLVVEGVHQSIQWWADDTPDSIEPFSEDSSDDEY